MNSEKTEKILSAFNQLKDEDQQRMLYLLRDLDLMREIDLQSKELPKDEIADFLRDMIDNHTASAAA